MGSAEPGGRHSMPRERDKYLLRGAYNFRKSAGLSPEGKGFAPATDGCKRRSVCAQMRRHRMQHPSAHSRRGRTSTDGWLTARSRRLRLPKSGRRDSRAAARAPASERPLPG